MSRNKLPITAYRQALVQLPLVCESTNISLRQPANVLEVCGDLIELAQECFNALLLNTRNIMINRVLVTVGLVDSSLVHPREVFREAIRSNASAVILAHNHPSGNTAPSAEDLRITRQLVEAGKIININVLDHVIIGRPQHVGDPGFLSQRSEQTATPEMAASVRSVMTAVYERGLRK